jgi:hypothetical protein
MDIEPLINEYFDHADSMSPERAAQLSQWITRHPDHARLFLRYMFLHQGLHNHFNAKDIYKIAVDGYDIVSEDPDNSGFFDEALWGQLAEGENRSPKVYVPSSAVPAVVSGLHQTAEIRTHRHIPWISVILSAAAVLLIGMLLLIPAGNPCAVVVDAIDARWDGRSESADVGDTFYDTDKLRELISGFVKLEFKSGVTMVIEGPCTFSCVSDNAFYLDRGQVFTHVPKHTIGFRIDSPISSIVDLGTEFGVQAQFNGTTSFHMFDGKAKISSRLSEKSTGKLLEKDHACQLNAKSGRIETAVLKPYSFVQSIDSKSGFVWKGRPVNLADIVGGGDGFGSGLINAGLDPVSGEFVNGPDCSVRLFDKCDYIQVNSNPYIDGVFAVDGGVGEIQVDSGGHYFGQFPDTDGLYAGPVLNGGQAGIGTNRIHSVEMDSVEYGHDDHPVVMMIPNVGITFDLMALRNRLPGLDITEFSALCGISDTVREYIGQSSFDQGQRGPRVDFRVLLDGQQVLEQRYIAGEPPAAVRVAIRDRHRFLTLVSTDGGDNILLDWFICAHPVLKLSVK